MNEQTERLLTGKGIAPTAMRILVLEHLQKQTAALSLQDLEKDFERAPNAVTLAILFAAYLVLHITMRMEEDFLTARHGQAYLDYKTKVRRLI